MRVVLAYTRVMFGVACQEVLLLPLSKLFTLVFLRRVNSMVKIGKAGAAIVLGLILSLTLFASGAFAQSTSVNGNSASAATRTATMTTVPQATTEATQPLAARQANGNQVDGRWCRSYHCHRYRHFRCYRVFRGGWWGHGHWHGGRFVRVCRSWWGW